MSGGVDSSVAAALLMREGYDVIGVTLKLWSSDCPALVEDRCCGPQAIADARAVASTLGIPHLVVDLAAEFDRSVIRYFIAEYQAGRTPNPCVVCNQVIKFGLLMKRAFEMGAECVATGHYARVEPGPSGYRLCRARDLTKDQSDFLFTLTQDQLTHVRMPLGGLTKEEVRALAREQGFVNADKEESQDICFAGDRTYADFVKARLGPAVFHPGEMVDREGRVLGRHEGIELYTVGQRKGINVGSPKPLYVLAVDAASSRVIVGDEKDLWHAELRAEQVHWGAEGPVADGTEALVKIRHSHPGAVARLHPGKDDSVRVGFAEPQRAITPGQAAVFYRDDVLIGGGWIAGRRKAEG